MKKIRSLFLTLCSYILLPALIINYSVIYAQGKSNLKKNLQKQNYVFTQSEKSFVLIKDRSQSVSDSREEIDFELGIRDDFIFMFYRGSNIKTNNAGNSVKFSYYPNLHLSAGLRLLNYYKIDFRIGLTLVDENYSGLDEGLYFQADLFKTNIYGIAGIDFFNDIGEDHNLGVSSGKFVLYCIGTGYEFSKNFNIDLTYNIPNKKIYGYSRNLGYLPQGQTYNMVNNGLLKIGAQISIVL